MLDGAKIKRLREARGLSLRGLAERTYREQGVGISHELIRKVEEGITLDILSSQAGAMAAALGVGIGEIQMHHAAPAVAKGA